MPIDYFAPDFYNNLQPRLRARITNTKVALLPDITLFFMHNSDERLTDKQFNAKCGGTVLAQYELVAEDELEDVEEADWLVDDDEDENMSSEDEEDYGVNEDMDMATRQHSLAAQLSSNNIA
jgi:hypothetical protein